MNIYFSSFFGLYIENLEYLCYAIYNRTSLEKRNDEIMKSFQKYSALECEQIEKIRKIGELYGNSPELKAACKESYNLYRSGRISADCYGKIYSEALDNYLGVTV